jgi:hypothetical protein
MQDTVYIVAKGDGWDAIEEVPKGSIIYGVNDACLRTPEITHTFHMHDLYEYGRNRVTESSTRLLKRHVEQYPDMELYSLKEYRDFPSSKVYPLEEVVEFFNLPAPYFTSGPEYAIAYAIMKGFKHIYYLGLNMSVGKEYIDQKPGCEFWTGIAIGRGCKVYIQHEYSSLLKSRDSNLYGYFTKQWRVY